MGRIVLHTAANREVDAATLRDMFRLRYEVFKERLQWDIVCPNGLDCDDFDALNPVYALYLNDLGRVEGCWRILPTTGPYMLKDVFPQLVENEPVPRHGDVWEISRFAVSSLDPRYSSLASLHWITGQLLVTLLEFGLNNRIKRFVAASDVRFERILKRSGLTVHRMGSVQRIGTTPSVAGWIHVTPEHMAQVMERCPVALEELQAA